MAVKMRLMRMGKTKSPHYRVVVIDGRAPRDGRYIDLIGRYDPRQDPSLIEIDADKAVEWLRKGAQPTEAVSKILDAAGALTQFKVKAGKIHTIGAPKADQAPQAQAAAEAEEAPKAEEASAAGEQPEATEAEAAEEAPDEAVAEGSEADVSEEE
jgi:small subunit ribosomal protein S16